MTTDEPDDYEGFLTEEDHSYLVNQCDDQTRAACKKRLRRLLPAVLEDLMILWRYLPEEDLRAVFEDAPGDQQHSVRSATESITALLYYAAKLNGDDIEYRFTQGMKAAEAVRGDHAEIDFDVRTSPLLSPTETITRLEESEHGFHTVSDAEREQLWRAPEVSPERIARVFGFGEGEETIEEVVEDIQAMRDADEPERRPPFTTIVDVKPAVYHDDETDDK